MTYTKFIRLIIAVLLPALFISPANSQSKKEIKKLKIKTITETTTVFDNGRTITYKSEFISYFKNAKLTEKTEYNRDGSIIRKETAAYDSQGYKIEESIYESADAPKKNIRIISKYDAEGNKIEDMEYDGAGKLIRKQQFSYSNLNNKKQELTFDASGKLKRKVTYAYDSDGLRTERKEYNEKNELVSERKYQYTF